MHAIQVGCEICEGAHLAKDCPLKEEKKTEEVKYGEGSLSKETIAIVIVWEHLRILEHHMEKKDPILRKLSVST